MAPPSGSVDADEVATPNDSVPSRAAGARASDLEVRVERSRWVWTVAIACGIGLFLVHLVQVAQLRTPIIYYDEGGYLGNARYMVSGYGRNGGAYYAGYSILLTPAAAVANAATTFFHAALITNAVLAVAAAALALVLSRQVVPDAPEWVALAASAVVAVCPFVFTYVGIAMSENALIPTTLLAAVFVGRAARTGARWPRVGVVLASGFAYWVTARGVIVVGAALLALLVLTYEHRRRWTAYALEVGLMAVVLLGGQLFQNAVRGTARVTGVTQRRDGLFDAVFDPGQWRMWAGALFGHFAYLGLASVGFVLIGVVVGAVWLAPRGGRSLSELARVRRSVSVFAVAAVVVTAVADATAVAGHPSLARLDYVYYGRYAEAVAMPAVVIGTSWMFATALSRRAGSFRTAMVAAVTAGTTIGVMALLARTFARPVPPDSTVNPVTVLAVFPLRILLADLGIASATVTKALLAGSVVVTITLALISWRARWFAVLPILLLMMSSFVVHDRYLRPGSKSRASHNAIANAIKELGAHGVPISCVDSAPPISSFWFFGNYQFLLPETNFTLPGDPPNRSCALLITSDANWAAGHPMDRLVAMENHERLGLWLRTPVLAPELLDRTEREGLYIPGPVCASLPDDAYRAAIEARPDDTSSPSSDLRDLRVALDIEHQGAGAPWLGSYALTDDTGCGRVEVLLSVESEHGETVAERVVPTPSVLFPGETWHLNPLVVGGATKSDLAPGQRYQLRVRLVHRGVRDFGGRDGRGVTVPLGST
jgi:hypothetical protein